MNRPISRQDGPLPFLALAILSLGLLLSGCREGSRGASSYPNRSLNLIVPWAAGGGTDRVARFVADALHRRVGQPVIVVNRTGGGGAVGHSAGALAAPDGHTLTMATFELSTMHWMGISKLTCNDFLPVAQLNGDAAAILVRHDAPWKNLDALLETIRKQSAGIKMSGTFTGGAWDLARSGLLLAAGIAPSSVIWAPTQGAAPALVELLGGHVDAVCCSVPEAASQLESAQVRLLAVLGPERLADFPDYPTAREQGVAYDAVGWRGIVLPRNTPAEIATFLGAKLTEIAASDDFRQFMKKNGFAVVVRGPGEFAEFLRAEDAKWRDVIKNAGYETLAKNHDPGPKAMPILLATLLVLSLALETVRSRKRHEPCGSRREEAPCPNSENRKAQTETEQSILASAATFLDPGASSLSADALMLLAALVIYVAVMPWIGFAPSTLFFTFAVMWRLGTRWWLATIGAVVIVLSIHLLFVLLFKVQLP